MANTANRAYLLSLVVFLRQHQTILVILVKRQQYDFSMETNF